MSHYMHMLVKERHDFEVYYVRVHDGKLNIDKGGNEGKRKKEKEIIYRPDKDTGWPLSFRQDFRKSIYTCTTRTIILVSVLKHIPWPRERRSMDRTFLPTRAERNRQTGPRATALDIGSAVCMCCVCLANFRRTLSFERVTSWQLSYRTLINGGFLRETKGRRTHRQKRNEKRRSPPIRCLTKVPMQRRSYTNLWNRRRRAKARARSTYCIMLQQKVQHIG